VRSVALLLILLCWAGSAYATWDDPAHGELLSAGHWQLSVAGLKIDDKIDIFDIRESRLDDVNAADRSDTLGDLKGLRLGSSWGASPRLTVSGGYQYLQLVVSPIRFELDRYQLSALYGPPPRPGKWRWFVGTAYRYERAADQFLTRTDDLNRLVRRFDSDLSIQTTADRVVFTDGDVTVSSPIVTPDGTTKPALMAGLDDVQSQTLRWQAGLSRAFNPVRFSLFAALERHWLDGDLVHSFDDYGLDDAMLSALGVDNSLKRTETVWQLGASCHVDVSRRLAGRLSWMWLKADRGAGLDVIDTNHHLRAELYYAVMDQVTFHLGAEYFYRQLNGIVPVLYNRYTQTTFDHDYGFAFAGLTVHFGD